MVVVYTLLLEMFYTCMYPHVPTPTRFSEFFTKNSPHSICFVHIPEHEFEASRALIRSRSSHAACVQNTFSPWFLLTTGLYCELSPQYMHQYLHIPDTSAIKCHTLTIEIARKCKLCIWGFQIERTSILSRVDTDCECPATV